MRDDAVVGRVAEEGDRGQQRGLEPAAVLVVALEVEIGRAAVPSPRVELRPRARSAAPPCARRPSRTRRRGCRSRPGSRRAKAAAGPRRAGGSPRPAARTRRRRPPSRKMPATCSKNFFCSGGSVRPGIDARALAVAHGVEERDRGAPPPLARDRPTRAGSRPCPAMRASPQAGIHCTRGDRRERRPRGRRSSDRRAARTTGPSPGRSRGSCSASSGGTRGGTAGRRRRGRPPPRRSSTISGLASRTFLPRYFATVV